MRKRILLLLISYAVVGVFACSSRNESPTLEGTWIGSYAMSPAIFNFHDDSVAVSLAGKYQKDRFEHADTTGASIIHIVRPNVWIKIKFTGNDSADVIVNEKEKIAVARQ